MKIIQNYAKDFFFGINSFFNFCQVYVFLEGNKNLEFRTVVLKVSSDSKYSENFLR